MGNMESACVKLRLSWVDYAKAIAISFVIIGHVSTRNNLSDEVLVGCTFTEVQDDYIRPSRIMYVTYVAVDETFRKHGIGRMLFAKVEDECKQKRCTAIELTSADFRTDAHAFYNKLGFTKKKTTLFIKEL